MNKYKFYFIPRTDMASMTPGRMIAQATHAAQNFSEYVKNIRNKTISTYPLPLAVCKYTEWINETPYWYGTSIILKPNTISNQCEEFTDMQNYFLKNNSVICYKLIDPEYFIKDGKTYHLLENVCTGIYFFGSKRILDTYSKYHLFDMEFKNE